VDLDGKLYGEISYADGCDRMAMTISEIKHVALRPETGASAVVIEDRGETDPATGALVRDFDRVTLQVGKLGVEIRRDQPLDPWVWQIPGHPDERGEIRGAGDVLRLVHRALRLQDLPIPNPPRQPSKLRAFDPDYD